jgi:hypothetical protein
LREYRSANVDTNGVARAITARRTAMKIPNALAPPTPYAQTETAVE